MTVIVVQIPDQVMLTRDLLSDIATTPFVGRSAKQINISRFHLGQVVAFSKENDLVTDRQLSQNFFMGVPIIPQAGQESYTSIFFDH